MVDAVAEAGAAVADTAAMVDAVAEAGVAIARRRDLLKIAKDAICLIAHCIFCVSSRLAFRPPGPLSEMPAFLS